ncbi:gamma-glutamyltransferase family protein, partial [Candidatus Thorarchaeota archaeon]
FALVHLAGSSKPIGYNGSGHSGSLVTLTELLDQGWQAMPIRGGPTVTVPGAMHLWHTLIDAHGQLEFSDVLAPAIHYATNGFPVSPIISEVWGLVSGVLRNDYGRRIFTVDGAPPRMGQLMRNPDLAEVFRGVAHEGLEYFYNGEVAELIVNTVADDGGFLTVKDMKRHSTTMTEPVSLNYRGFDVFEHPPNGQGFAALVMLGIMEEMEVSTMPAMSAERYHVMIEAKKLAYADLYAHNADPDFYNVPLEELLSQEYLRKRAGTIEREKAMGTPVSGLAYGDDTIYLATADKDGNAVSFINSLYMGFGSGLVVPGTGIKLQNRGSLFKLDPEHPNAYAPNKRPFHTIIPGAVYRDAALEGVFGIMGGPHQAQAHAQFISNAVDHDMSPQEALDYPRFHHDQEANVVALENGVPPHIQGALRKRGHELTHETSFGFGGGQAIFRLEDAWIAGSDFRKDGQAAGF